MRLLAALVLACVCFTEAAKAQCGWILWDKYTTPTGTDGKGDALFTVRWEAVDGYADIRECRSVGEEKLKQMTDLQRQQNTFVVAEPGGRHGIFGKSQQGADSYIQEFLCFPSGFDPRK